MKGSNSELNFTEFFFFFEWIFGICKVQRNFDYNKRKIGIDWLMWNVVKFKKFVKYQSVLIINFSLQDRKGLENPKAVETIQDRLIEALKLQILRNHSTEENLFGTTIVKLPQLRTLGVQHDEILEWYRAQWNRVRLPPLFSEIYDISKHEEDM